MAYRVECRLCGAGIEEPNLLRAIEFWVVVTIGLRSCPAGRYAGYRITKSPIGAEDDLFHTTGSSNHRRVG